MTDKILIDGWNLAWKIPEVAALIPDKLSEARARLNIILKNYFHRKKVTFKIVYDGRQGIISNARHGIDVQFAHKPETADHLIVKHLRKQKEPARWTVITSDQELSGRCRNLGTFVLSAENFYQKLKKKVSEMPDNNTKHDPNLSKDEMDFWLKKFKS